jgi:hypothetical protein
MHVWIPVIPPMFLIFVMKLFKGLHVAEHGFQKYAAFAA